MSDVRYCAVFVRTDCTILEVHVYVGMPHAYVYTSHVCIPMTNSFIKCFCLRCLPSFVSYAKLHRATNFRLRSVQCEGCTHCSTHFIPNVAQSHPYTYLYTTYGCRQSPDDSFSKILFTSNIQHKHRARQIRQRRRLRKLCRVRICEANRRQNLHVPTAFDTVARRAGN